MTAHTSEARQGAYGRTSRRTIFLSYCRHDESLAASIGRDLTDMGVDVWRDERLSGGQAWWDTILESIRDADAVLFVLSGDSLESVPCGRELEYSRALGKPILPVRIDGTSPGVAPPFLASLEWVDYSMDDRVSVIRLMRAVNALPPSPEPPDPLPPPPEVPLSYTTNLAALVHQPEDLTAHEQHSLLFELREGLSDAAHRDECAQLMRQLRSRRELLASVGRQVDEALDEDRSGRGEVPQRTLGHDSPPGTGPSQRPSDGPPVDPPVWTAPPVPPRGRSSRRLGLILGALAVALLLIPAFILFRFVLAPTTPDVYGDDPALDSLWDNCADGDFAACDTLYTDAPVGSGYEEFGSTCGDLGEATSGSCSSILDDAPFTYGDDPSLDDLWDGCAGGDFEACDSLYYGADVDSQYETFGDTCGDRGVTLEGTCASTLPFPFIYGDDADLDALQDACVAGDLATCDALFFGSPTGSEYERLGSFCGGQATEPKSGACSGG